MSSELLLIGVLCVSIFRPKPALLLDMTVEPLDADLQILCWSLTKLFVLGNFS